MKSCFENNTFYYNADVQTSIQMIDWGCQKLVLVSVDEFCYFLSLYSNLEPSSTCS